MPKSLRFTETDGRAGLTTTGTPSQTVSNRSSPTRSRRTPLELSFSDLRSHSSTMPAMATDLDETTSLLPRQSDRSDREPPSHPPSLRSRQISRVNSKANNLRMHRTRASTPSSPLFVRNSGLRTPRTIPEWLGLTLEDDRLWYDQFTSTDWVHDSIADGYRVLEMRKRKGFAGKLWQSFDALQGWILVALVGCITAAIAYFVDVTESAIFHIRTGVCRDGWYKGRSQCCSGGETCDQWLSWSQLITPSQNDNEWINYMAFVAGTVLLALVSCFITLQSKTVVPSSIATTFDENLGAHRPSDDVPEVKDTGSSKRQHATEISLGANTYYSAAGSGVAEVKVILSGFVLHGYLGLRTLIIKMAALVFSVASGMSLGKEGPYVHIATCVGNIACRVFSKYNLNDGKRREVLSASAASGVAVAFGAPIGGVLFSLEEVSYFFPPKTLFRTFFCSIVAALCLKFLNPYGTWKIVLFEIRYVTDWHYFELFNFLLLGFAGGLLGALFIKASRVWATTFRRLSWIKGRPVFEVFLVALATGIVSFWNRYTRLAVAELLFELASPCDVESTTGLCPTEEDIPKVIQYLCLAFIVKAFLTTVTFGIKVPAGIYVPSMVVGGLMGRIVGHTTQYLVLKYPDFIFFQTCPNDGNTESCVVPGVYALAAAGATMCGVTRLSVTLAVILFELTGSLDHVLPFSLAILCAKWTADAVEPLSIYDLLLDINAYPYIENKVTPIFDSELGDITSRFRPDMVIDITISPLLRAGSLREKLSRLQAGHELDGGLPVIRDKILVGLIPAPDLDFALDRLDETGSALCLMSKQSHHRPRLHQFRGYDDSDRESTMSNEVLEFMTASNPIDFTPYVDPAPLALDIHTPMTLVYESFVKLGLRYVCVLENGEFFGMVHKKSFVRYLKTLGDENMDH